jgi:hypothetical protein
VRFRQGSSCSVVLLLTRQSQAEIEQTRANASAIAELAFDAERALEGLDCVVDTVAVQGDHAHVVVDPGELLEIRHVQRGQARARVVKCGLRASHVCAKQRDGAARAERQSFRQAIAERLRLLLRLPGVLLGELDLANAGRVLGLATQRQRRKPRFPQHGLDQPGQYLRVIVSRAARQALQPCEQRRCPPLRATGQSEQGLDLFARQTGSLRDLGCALEQSFACVGRKRRAGQRKQAARRRLFVSERESGGMFCQLERAD